MPLFSAFCPYGTLAFTSRKAHGEVLYRDQVANRGEGENFSTERGSVIDGITYANCMAYARARYTVERAGQQFRPTKAVEMLPKLEWEYGIVPSPGSSIKQRQLAVAAAAKLARGARKDNVEAVLTDLLGDDFIVYIPASKTGFTETTNTPASVGNWEKPGSSKAVYRLVGAPFVSGVAENVTIERIAGEASITAGQKLVLDVGDWNRTETVEALLSSSTTLRAVFTKPHSPGCMAVTGRVPNLGSTKRTNLVILSAAAMNDPERKRKANNALRKLLRGVSIWYLGEGTASASAGPWRVNYGRVNRTTIGAVSY